MTVYELSYTNAQGESRKLYFTNEDNVERYLVTRSISDFEVHQHRFKATTEHVVALLNHAAN